MPRRTRTVVAMMALLSWGFPPVALAEDTGPPGGVFVDDDANVHEGYIEAIAAERITLGCDPPMNLRYCPGQAVTRGQMAAFLQRAFGLQASGENPFSDTGVSVFADDIAAIEAVGITKGCNPPANTLFCPDEPVTRGQMAAFLRRALGLDSGAASPFTDDDTSVFERDIAELAAAGITKGCNPPANTMFCPHDLVTRAQAASLLGRALHLTPSVPAARSEVFDAVSWSVVLPDAEHPERTYGWVAADFFDRGVAMMDLRVYDTPDATVAEQSVHALEPFGGEWSDTLLMPDERIAAGPSPLALAADGDRIAVAASPPAVHLFTRTATGWDEEVISLDSAVQGGEFNAAVAIAGDRVAVLLDSSRFAVLDWDGSKWDLAVHSAATPMGAWSIDLDGDIVAFGSEGAVYVATREGDDFVIDRLTPIVEGHNFGSSVDVDNGRILVAANGATPGPGTSGAVYLYARRGGEWVGETVATGGEGFGDSARLSGHTIVCGGRHADQGTLWIYEETDRVWKGREVMTGFDSWVGDLSVERGNGIAIHFSGLRAPHTAVLFAVD